MLIEVSWFNSDFSDNHVLYIVISKHLLILTILHCVLGGRRHRVGYSRARRSRDEAGEEGSNLVDYDELSLEWQSQDINDVT